MSRGRLYLLVSVALVVLTVATYGRLWQNDFIDLDDETYVTKNLGVLGGLTPRGIKWAWTTWHGGFWFPLTWMSLQLDASLSGKRLPFAPVFHAHNLLWHTATVVLLFLVLARMTGSTWRSALVAALFAVHPLHVESVAWATERKDVLSTFFWVLTLAAYVRYVERPGADRYQLVVAAFVLGLLAKPMLVTLPCTLLLLDWWPLSRWGWGAKESSFSRGLGRVLLEKVPLFVIAFAFSALTVFTQQHGVAVVPLDQVSRSARVANAVYSYAWYLEKTFWPTSLTVFYVHPRGAWQWPPILTAGAVLLVVSVLALATARRMPWLLVGWLWFLGTMVPVIGLVQVGDQARGDRFVYVPHIGLFIAIVWTAAALLQRLRVPAVAQAGLAAGCVAALVAVSWRQEAHWRNTETIWEHAIAVDPNNDRARANLAGFLMVRYGASQDPAEKAALLRRTRDEYETVIAIQPDVAENQYNLGVVYVLLGELDAASERFLEALNRNKQHANAWHNLGVVRLRQNRAKNAENCFRKALEVNPRAADSRAHLGTVLWQQGRHEEAIAEWDGALKENPSDAEALSGKALDLLQQGRDHQAVAQLTAAVQTNPSPGRYSLLGIARGREGQWQRALEAHATALQAELGRAQYMSRPVPADLALYRRRLAFTLQTLGQAETAAREYREALRLDPDWPRAAVTEAWRLATNADPKGRDPVLARELASMACRATADPSAEALDALAATLAATGRHEEAARTARRALAQASPELAKAIASRLKIYEAGKAITKPRP
jgi:tetratricopeptide (TPR) repeat protein